MPLTSSPGRRRLSALLIPLLLPLLLVGCTAGDDPGSAGDGVTTPRATSPRTAGSSTTGAAEPTTSAARPQVQVLATDLDLPWGLVRLPDGGYLVSSRDEARVSLVSPDGTVSAVPATGPQGRVPGVEPGGEGGLLGLAMAPGVPDRLYAYLTSGQDNRVVAMPYRGGRLGVPTTLLTGIPRATNHNGGRLAFGPDRFLYVSTGDAGDGAASQDKENLGGKILRITTTGAPAPGNPFPRSPVWSYGHRNVQGLAWDPAGRMYASEFGQNTWDELNRIEPGRNYGWPTVEGTGTAADAERGFTAPLTVWRTDQASPSGIVVAGGAVWMAALRGQRLWRVPLTASGGAGRPTAVLQGTYGRLRTVAVDPDGALVVLTSNSSRGTGAPDDDRLLRVRGLVTSATP